MATLISLDLPQAIEDRGGWASADRPNWFEEYSALMYRELDDRIPCGRLSTNRGRRE